MSVSWGLPPGNKQNGVMEIRIGRGGGKIILRYIYHIHFELKDNNFSQLVLKSPSNIKNFILILSIFDQNIQNNLVYSTSHLYADNSTDQ